MKDITSSEFFTETDTGISLIDFWSSHCIPCNMLTPLLDKISTEHPEVKFLKVNVDNEFELCMRYEIASVPTIVVIKDGKTTGKLVGLPQPAILATFIENNLK